MQATIIWGFKGKKCDPKKKKKTVEEVQNYQLDNYQIQNYIFFYISTDVGFYNLSPRRFSYHFSNA